MWTLRIKELQNVDHARNALQANLKDKEYLDELKLEWSTDNENSQNERDVLDKLRPHANLKRLTIKNYGGTRFPDWLGVHSICNMVFLRLDNCKYCFSLPPLGQLPCLKGLWITGFDGVERVGPEFYGNSSSANKPFGSLEILSFEKMSVWEEWISFEEEVGEFPLLRELWIRNCPKLAGGLPGHLPSLTELWIDRCQQLVASLPRAPAIRVLELSNCDNVVLRSNDDQMTTLPNRVGLQPFSRLEELKIMDMSQLKELPPWTQRLTIKDLKIHSCPSLESFPRGGLPTTLNGLYISNCGKLELLLPEAEEMMHNYFASLEKLTVWDCDSLKSFPLGLFPKLNYLYIWRCMNLESLGIPEVLHNAKHIMNLKSLNTLSIESCPKLVSFPKGGLPTPNLTSFSVSYCKNLKSLPERMHALLPSLQHLNIGHCPELESFREGDLPSNLISLSVCNCNKLTARRMEWGLQTLASLKKFYISESEEVESFPEEWLLPSTLTSLAIFSLPNLKYLDKWGLQHLTSLQELRIYKCPKLQCFPEEELLTSLQKLRIYDCPKLQCFPEEELLTSLSLLDIQRSPLLEQRCQREKGEDWLKIAHIPCIVIDEELIS